MSYEGERQYSKEEIAANEHEARLKNDLEREIMSRYLENFPESDSKEKQAEWVALYAKKFGDLVAEDHAILSQFELSMDQHPEIQEVLVKKIEGELY